jgi:hypothetical protein
MRSPVSNYLAATLSVPVVILSRLPNHVVALIFFLLRYGRFVLRLSTNPSLLIKKYNI